MENPAPERPNAIRLGFITITQLVLLLLQAIVAGYAWFMLPEVKFEQLWMFDAGIWFAIGSAIVSAMLFTAGMFIPGWKMMLLRLLILVLHAGLSFLVFYVCVATLIGRC